MNLRAVVPPPAPSPSRASIGGPPLDSAGAADDFGSVEVISLAGPFEASAEERKLLCLLADGRLLVADGQHLNAHVLSYQARLQKMGRPFQVLYVRIDTVRRLNQSGGLLDRHQEHSMMQVTAKELLSRACQARASDIHIRVRSASTEIHFRIHNDLLPVGGQTREYGERLLATLYGAMTSVSDSSYKPSERQDASIADRDKLPPGLYGVRIATVPTSEGTLMVLRLLYNDAGDNVDLHRLGFAPAHVAVLQQLKEQPIGLNIISGPTGSGKSTTLQRVLQGELLEACGRLHVLTVEDPVEYPIDGAVQTSVTNAGSEEDRARLFAAAISNAMRLDPDTIMIGEVRDRASAQNALRAAMTGHQVWTTVHANSAAAIVDRLLDLGLPASLVADHTVITGLISQRLVKALCPHCKVELARAPGVLAPSVAERVAQVVSDLRQVYVTGPGCPHCAGRGTTGRTVLAEIIVPDEQFFRHIRQGDKSAAVAHWLQELGGRTIVDHAIEKVAAGLIDPRMAEQVVGRLMLRPGQSARRLQVVGDGDAV
ncbi:type II secretory ATPase GspE/PulE/Tfp pilus assembly ATPase PilB-like protein [Pseudoduganella flava]|uniref:Secretion system protein E n=1 Tax=Pseudoduganella flava TaxID=871742 RepID=A0A562PDQ9_9BURK|nr:ATPase, T2SS/T4P/T4SS family [Pseudoduganella flava]QGZ42150.1 secretion system protein E [Pseudoduganella flava]TWI42473.1 type II secretory ATPase GspE/PulE/Tfp pilus assembly ATPase PilB-like protein [Pseudoduganella flava]